MSNPASETVQLGYGSDGLLTSLTDPRGNASTFAYDSLGRLERDEDEATGFIELARTELFTAADQPAGYEVTKTTAEGRTTTYRVEDLPGGSRRLTNISAAGLEVITEVLPDGTLRTTAPDGTVTDVMQDADPRFGLLGPILSSSTITTPGGLESEITASRTVTLSDSSDLFSLATQLDTLEVNGRVFVNSYDAGAREFAATTPEGRTSVGAIDSLGRVVKDSTAGLAAVGFAYDGQGRLSQLTQASRTWTYDYDAAGRLLSVVDPEARADSFFYDGADRLTRQVLPDGREVLYGYDGAGNLTSVTPPGRPAHDFTYTSVNLADTYAPPDLTGGPTPTGYSYNLDRQLTRITRPDSQTIDFAYDSAGRASAVTVPGGEITYGYDPTKGNRERRERAVVRLGREPELHRWRARSRRGLATRPEPYPRSCSRWSAAKVSSVVAVCPVILSTVSVVRSVGPPSR